LAEDLTCCSCDGDGVVPACCGIKARLKATCQDSFENYLKASCHDWGLVNLSQTGNLPEGFNIILWSSAASAVC
jgi:hypothetical protein